MLFVSCSALRRLAMFLESFVPARAGLLLAASLLLGCGGGGGSGGTPAGPLPTVETSAVAMADPGSTLPADWAKGVFMEIYVRGYKDSDGDGIGDLKGLTQSLDYLKDLGVSGIWLMPVNTSQDHDHGYAVTDYRGIETQYGSLADFDELLAQAHARGIGVIIDYVMNHSAAQHPAFVNARAATDNPYRDWYVWQASRPSGWSIYGNDPWHPGGTGYYFAGFWDQMPDFNLLNP
ncbi:partial alpha-amylase, partial [Gammaproteobacteria bacterium]